MSQRWLRWIVRRLREAVRDSQGLIPAIGAIAGLILAAAIGSDDPSPSASWTVSVDRSRATMGAALALMFTSLSVVLGLASVATQNIVSRFGSRTLRIYMRRSFDRWVTGAFTLAATFILVEQFQLRKLDSFESAPSEGLLISVVLLVLVGVMVIWYVTSVVRWLRVDEAVSHVREAERRALESVSRHRRGTTKAEMPPRPDQALDLLSPRSGYLAEFDLDSMLKAAKSLDALVVITRPLGAAVVEREPIGWFSSRSELASANVVAERVDLAGTREVTEVIEHPLYALVDIAIIALSPAVNDPNTAVEVIEQMGFLFAEIAKIPIGPYAVPDVESWPRVVVAAHTFGELVELATSQIVLYGKSDPNVASALQRLAATFDLLDLNDADRRHVVEFAASVGRVSSG